MTNELATKIAVLTSELGKLARQVRSAPDDDECRVMASVCSVDDAAYAAQLAVGVISSVALGSKAPGTAPAQQLIALIDNIARSMTFLHVDSDKRVVTGGEVLRLIADKMDLADRGDPLLEAVKRVLNKVGVTATTIPPPADNGKPGSN